MTFTPRPGCKCARCLWAHGDKITLPNAPHAVPLIAPEPNHTCWSATGGPWRNTRRTITGGMRNGRRTKHRVYRICGEIKDFQDSSILNVSVHPGYTDKNTNQWVDKEPQFYGVRPLSNQAKDALNQVRQLKSQPNMSVKVLVNGSLSKRVSEKDGKRYENWDVAARTIAVLSAKPKAQQSGFQQSQQQYQQGFQQPQQGFQQPQQQYQQPTDPWSQPQDEYGNGQI